ncbi:MAG TPA: hypothetical protein DCY12_05995 [Candidatus Atribacteria bacterium]|nr:hypothetical protein [Candidatus Atribacteria bacterium]
MEDLTIIYLTANLLPEPFVEFTRQALINVIGNTPVVSVSRKPINFGENIIDDGEKSLDNIYRQMLRAAKVAKTKYVAMAEDDTLYPETHFRFYRPADDTFGYNKNRMSLFTWGEPMYHWRNRLSNCTLIAPRELLIEALEERFTKHPERIPDMYAGELGRPMVEIGLGLKPRKCEEVFSKLSVIQINHDFASEERQRTHKKSYGYIRAYDIPYWGKASELLEKTK